MALRVVLLLLMCFLCSFGHAQDLCEGNLGVNIFEGGDFGSGTANTLATDPGVAPGYIYVNGLPDDGFYTITNNTGAWANIWPSWLEIGDNSNDPNGYMMVVNASFEPGIFFEQRITGLCDNTLYEFSADMINMIRDGVPGHILPRVSFLLDGEQKFSTGGIPQTNRWRSYGFTFVTEPGQTELLLTLQNSAPGGIGNDIALDNISFRPCGPSAFINTDRNIFLCEDDNQPARLTADLSVDEFAIQWQTSRDGINWTDLPDGTQDFYLHDVFDVGVYYYRYLSATSNTNLANEKCRVLSEVIKIEVLPLEYSEQATICEGTAYNHGTQVLTEAGLYTESFVSSRGCDSVVMLDLDVVANELEMVIDALGPSCVSTEDGRINVTTVIGANGMVMYDIDGESTGRSFFDSLGQGRYIIGVQDIYGCRVEDTVDLISPDAFIIDAGPDLELAFGATINLQLTANRDFMDVTWEPPLYLSCADCEDPILGGAQTISYIVSALDERSCRAYDTLHVSVNRDDVLIYFPNVFSPNGDGVNDHFGFGSFGSVIKEIVQFSIFDRWGNMVYTASGTSTDAMAWDGRWKGQDSEPGVYTYVAEFILLDDSPYTKSGNLTLLR